MFKPRWVYGVKTFWDHQTDSAWVELEIKQAASIQYWFLTLRPSTRTTKEVSRVARVLDHLLAERSASAGAAGLQRRIESGGAFSPTHSAIVIGHFRFNRLLNREGHANVDEISARLRAVLRSSFSHR